MSIDHVGHGWLHGADLRHARFNADVGPLRLRPFSPDHQPQVNQDWDARR